MGKYLLRRILQMIPVVLGTTLLVYALVFALPGDPVKAMFGDKPVNEAVAAQIRAEYNLDKPFIVQYLLFLKNALTLDFGKTFSGQLVIDVIGRAFPVTIKLALMAFVFEAVFGVIFGVISGLKKGKSARRSSGFAIRSQKRFDLLLADLQSAQPSSHLFKNLH
jgi:oligopeptide transport system permease protein